MMALCSVPSEASPSIIRAKTPMSPRRFHLLQSVFGGPYSRGESYHLKPLRLMKIIPLRIRRSSTRGLPWLFGKNGVSRSICTSVSQKRLLIIIPVSSGA